MRQFLNDLLGRRSEPGRILVQDGVRGMFCVRGSHLQGWVNSNEAKRRPKLWAHAPILIEARTATRTLRSVDVGPISTAQDDGRRLFTFPLDGLDIVEVLNEIIKFMVVCDDYELGLVRMYSEDRMALIRKLYSSEQATQAP